MIDKGYCNANKMLSVKTMVGVVMSFALKNILAHPKNLSFGLTVHIIKIKI